MANEALRADVVSAEKRVWEGEAISVIARTTEGDIGIMARHEPFLAALVPCAAEILTPDDNREILAVSDGFISVSDNKVAIITQFAAVAKEINAERAERELAEAEKALDSTDKDDESIVEVQQRYNRALAQVKAAYKVGNKS